MSAPPPPGTDEPQANAERREAARLFVLFAAGWLVFDYPLLGLWVGDATLLGVPLLPAALFAAWGAIVAALAWIAERSRD